MKVLNYQTGKEYKNINYLSRSESDRRTDILRMFSIYSRKNWMCRADNIIVKILKNSTKNPCQSSESLSVYGLKYDVNLDWLVSRD